MRPKGKGYPGEDVPRTSFPFPFALTTELLYGDDVTVGLRSLAGHTDVYCRLRLWLQFYVLTLVSLSFLFWSRWCFDSGRVDVLTSVPLTFLASVSLEF